MPRSGYDSVVLLTGYPTFGARQMLERIVTEEPKTLVYALVRRALSDEAEQALQSLDARARTRVVLLDGDASHMDLGLSGVEFRQVTSEVDRIHHCAQVTYPGLDTRTIEQGNVVSTREVLEVAYACSHLRCLVHHSTAFVSGDRRGSVYEGELEHDQKFRNAIEQTKARAEKLVRRAMAKVPIAVVRPTNIVGDSKTGVIDRLDGPYLVILLILTSPAEIAIPLPTRGDAPLHVVPIDYVTRAAHAIGLDPRAPGKTFHLVDPKPLTARRAFELVARAGGRRSPRGFLPANITKALLHTPGLERFAQSPRTFVEQLTTPVYYDARNTEMLLANTAITCPPFESYVDTLVDFVRERVRERREQRLANEQEADDPLS